MSRGSMKRRGRVSLGIRPEDKVLIARAAALVQTDLADFILGTALREAQTVVDQHEKIKLSPRDSVRVLDALENPPRPTAKLRRAARAIPALS